MGNIKGSLLSLYSFDYLDIMAILPDRLQKYPNRCLFYFLSELNWLISFTTRLIFQCQLEDLNDVNNELLIGGLIIDHCNEKVEVGLKSSLIVDQDVLSGSEYVYCQVGVLQTLNM